MDRLTAGFVEGMGAAAATSGILTQLQGRIFGLLYLQQGPLSLDEITEELQQSKSNVSVNIRGLVDWQLVRHVRVPNSRRDHYEAATDFWRVMQEILERRFRWNVRQVVSVAEETETAAGAAARRRRRPPEHAEFVARRMSDLLAFFTALDAGLSGFSRGESFAPQPLRRVYLTSGDSPAGAPRASSR